MGMMQDIRRDMAHKVGGVMTGFLCLTPVALLVAGSLSDPRWFWAALLWMILLAPAMDQLIPESPDPETGEGPDSGILSTAILVGVLFPLMALAVWSLPQLGFSLMIPVAFLAFGLVLGQVGMVAAHDLIHRRHRWAVWLGQAYSRSAPLGITPRRINWCTMCSWPPRVTPTHRSAGAPFMALSRMRGGGHSRPRGGWNRAAGVTGFLPPLPFTSAGRWALRRWRWSGRGGWGF